MTLDVLHFDDALLEQPRFMEACADLGGIQHDLREIGPSIRLWGSKANIDATRTMLRDKFNNSHDRSPPLAWIGSGDFHHVSAILAELRREVLGTPLTIVHFDNHPDWVSFSNGVHCGSWVRHVLDTGIAERVVSIGVSSRDLAWPEFKGAALDLVKSGKLILFPLDPPKTTVFSNYGYGAGHLQAGRQIVWSQFDPHERAEQQAHILHVIDTETIYLTIDKDVLRQDEAHTNWDQGQLSVEQLTDWIELLSKTKDIAGCDVIGDFSEARYGPDLKSRIWKRAEAFIDQPGRRSDSDTRARNEATNLRLLKALEMIIC